MCACPIDRLAVFAMGTRFELVLHPEDRPSLRPVGEAALGVITELDARWSVFRRDSLVSFLNRTAHERPVPVDEDTFAVLAAAQRIRDESGGLFDVTIGEAMRAWGFRDDPECDGARDRAEEPEVNRAPSGSSLPPGPLCLCHESRSIHFSGPGVSVDLGGIAKGYAVDAALRILRDHGVSRALLHGGTSCIGAIGAPPGLEGWPIAIAPAGEGETLSISLRDECLAVSSPSGREVERAHGRLGHILDPRTGAPGRCARVAAIRGPSATLCDAWTKPALLERARPRALPAEYTAILDAAVAGPARWSVAAPWNAAQPGTSVDVPPPSSPPPRRPMTRPSP